MGRPELQIDEEQVRKLASIGCTNCEIADFFNCDEGTIRKRFSETLTKGRAALKTRLRRAQLQLAIRGKNPTMLIWLGRNMLEQTDYRPEKEKPKPAGALKIVRLDPAKLAGANE